MSSYLVGQVRPSQLLWTYGPGALIDLPNLSVLTMGLDRWNRTDALRSRRHAYSPPFAECSALKWNGCGCPPF